MSFDDKRAALLRAAKEQSQERGVSKQVNFSNNGIPELLRNYQEYEKESRKTVIQTRK
jgi:hypothetical protein